ncbi:hypothetical protein [Parasitella parasitica]|uniref:Integrase catalytic domain-containing protein n=1 Tax=Parasitella parasitica TaxID=35722 RepID=A0A0B7MPV6_9FUNG|nr:hypothetical protein [Parasitella parasitica]
MKPITPTRIGEIWATDIAVFTESKQGNRFVLVIMEYLSKWAVTCALKSYDTDSIAQVLLYDVVLKYGLPSRIISDNGSSYISDGMTMVLDRLGISRSLTSVEHPQSDGLVERFNRTLKASLSIVAGQEPNTWCEYLPFVTFAYNTAKQASTGFSPFKIMHGRDAELPLFNPVKIQENTRPNARNWGQFLNRTIPMIHSKALENIKKAQDSQAKYYDKKSSTVKSFNNGDLVLRRNRKTGGFPKERWSGPWIITGPTNYEHTAYNITDKKNFKNTSKANVGDLRLWYSPS